MAVYVHVWVQNVFVCEAFLELLADVRPALNVRYSVMSSVARNLSALQIFQVSGPSGERQVYDWDIRKISNIYAQVLAKIAPGILKR